MVSESSVSFMVAASNIGIWDDQPNDLMSNLQHIWCLWIKSDRTSEWAYDSQGYSKVVSGHMIALFYSLILNKINTCLKMDV